MLESVNYAIEFATGIEFEHFVKDKMRYFAIMKNVEIIGEAAYMITNEFKDAHAELPWKQIIGMRHVLVHGYAQVSEEKLWNTVTKDLPQLQLQLRKYLEEYIE